MPTRHAPAINETDAATDLRKSVHHSLGFHAIRHFFAVCLMNSQQVWLTDIQQFLGHQRPTTTDIYLRSDAPNLGRLAGVIEGEM